MKLAVGAFLFLVYSFAISMGTPLPLLVLQALALAICAVAITAAAVRRRTLIFPIPFLLFFLGCILFFCLSMIIALEGGQTPVPVMMRFLQVFATTFAVPLLGYSLVKLGAISQERMLRNIINAVLAYTFVKLAIVAVVAIANIPQIIILKFFQYVFNADPAFGIFFLNIARFFGPTDFLDALVLYYFVFFGSGRWRIFWIVMLCASIFVSYSRFVWLEGLFVLSLAVFRLSRGQMLALLLGLTALVPAATLVNTGLIEQRFFSPQAAKADDIRRRQTEALTQDVDQNFLFGHGFASFSYTMVRDEQAPYSYEEQWLAIVYQLGVVGLLVVLALLASTLSPFLLNPTLEGLSLAVVFGFSLLSGFANPSLIGRAAGIGFAFVYFCSAMISDRASRRHHAGSSLLTRAPASGR